MDAARTRRVASRVRRRLLAGAVISRAGWGLVAGGAVGLVLVLATRMGWFAPAPGADAGAGTVPWWVLLSASVGVGLVIGGGLGVFRRKTMLEAAQIADAVSGLRDRLSNALSFSMWPEASASEQLAIADGERSTEQVDVRRVAPVRFGTAWIVGPLVIGCAVATGLFVPARQHGPATPVARRAPTEAQRSAAAEAIARAAAEARDTASGPRGARASAEELERMEQIERELLDGARSPDEALAEGAQQLESLAERVEREAAAESLTDQATREALADSIDATEDDSALAKALADGDLEAAREAASELFERMDQLSPEERQRFAAELDRLAEQTARAPDAGQQGNTVEPESAPSALNPRLDELLREQGLEDLAETAGSRDADEIRERLEREGVEPEAARRLADEIARENQKRAAEERANEAREQLSDAAREAADELREPPPPEPNGGEPPQQGERGQDGRQGGREQSADSEQSQSGEDGRAAPGQDEKQDGRQDGQQGQERQETDRSRDGAVGEERPGEQPRRGTGEQAEGRQEQGEQQSESGRPGQQGDEGQQSQQGQQRQQGQEDASGERRGAEQQTDGREAEGQGDRSGERSDQRTGDQQRDGDGAESGDQERPGGEGGNPRSAADRKGEQGQQGPERATDGQGEAPRPRGVERLREQLERMAERGESAKEKQRSAEKLREQAERMLDGASPAQREQLEQLAREMARPSGGEERGGGAGTGPRRAEGARPTPDSTWETEDVDARGEASGRHSEDGRVIAEWYGKDGEQSAGGSAAGGSAGSVVDDAARGAERAVERRAVPRERRELVRRVFERYRQRAAEREAEKSSDSSGGGS